MKVTQQKISGFLVTVFFFNRLIKSLNIDQLRFINKYKLNIPGTVSVPDIRTDVMSLQSLKGETFLNFKYDLSSSNL